MIFKQKYYIANVIGITENFEIESDGDISHSIYEAKKKSFGNIIVTKCIGGFKEILSGVKFKYIANKNNNQDNYYVAPKDTGIMVDANTIQLITEDMYKDVVKPYIETYDSNTLNAYFEYAKFECNSYLYAALLHKLEKNKLKK